MVKRSFILLLLVLSLGLFAGTCSAHQITDQELTRLEQIFNQLEQNNLQQDKQLERASLLLTKSETQINQLNTKLTVAEQSIIQAQTSLQKANQSLDKYEQETNKEIRKLKLERDLVIIGVIAMVVLKK